MKKLVLLFFSSLILFGCTQKPTENEELNLPPTKPALVYPQNGVVLINPGRITFGWLCSDPNGDALTYEFHIRNAVDPSFGFDEEGLTKKEYTNPPGLQWSNLSYYWWVTATDSKGLSAESNKSYFSTK